MAITKLPEMTVEGSQVAVGKDFLIEINTGTNDSSGVDWTLIGGQRSGKLGRTAEEIDASHKTSGGWKDSVAGLRGWSLECDSVVILNDKGAEALEFAFSKGLPVHCRFRYPNGENYIGWAAISDFSMDTSHTDVATLSIKLTGKGELKKGQKVSVPGIGG